MIDQLLSVGEFARALGISSSTVKNWIRSRRIGVVRIGRKVRIERNEVDRLLAAGRRPALLLRRQRQLEKRRACRAARFAGRKKGTEGPRKEA